MVTKLRVRSVNVIAHGKTEKFVNKATDFVTFLILMGCTIYNKVSDMEYLSFEVGKEDYKKVLDTLKDIDIYNVSDYENHAIRLVMGDCTKEKLDELVSIMHTYLDESDYYSETLVFDAY